MTKTYQTVNILSGWQVFCLETGEEVAVLPTKAAAIAKVAELNRRACQIAHNNHVHRQWQCMAAL